MAIPVGSSAGPPATSHHRVRRHVDDVDRALVFDVDEHLTERGISLAGLGLSAQLHGRDGGALLGVDDWWPTRRYG
jgi:hypothetical protein